MAIGGRARNEPSNGSAEVDRTMGTRLTHIPFDMSDIHADATVRVIWTDPNTGDVLVIFKWNRGFYRAPTESVVHPNRISRPPWRRRATSISSLRARLARRWPVASVVSVTSSAVVSVSSVRCSWGVSSLVGSVVAPGWHLRFARSDAGDGRSRPSPAAGGPQTSMNRAPRTRAAGRRVNSASAEARSESEV